MSPALEYDFYKKRNFGFFVKHSISRAGNRDQQIADSKQMFVE